MTSTARQVQVLLVDEALERRLALKRQLALSDFAIAGESGFGQEALALSRQVQPDVVIVAFEEPIARPLRTIEALTVSSPDVAVVAVSSLADGESIRKAMVAGARDYVAKPFSQRKLADAIREALKVQLRRRERAESKAEDVEPATVVTVFSAKGGVGKTTIATNLAVSLSAVTTQKVALVDIDMTFGDAAIMMGLVPRQDISSLARDIGSVTRDALYTYLTPHDSGVMLLASPTRAEDEQTITAEQTRSILQQLGRTFDYIVIDCPPALTASVYAALDASTLVLMVTTLEITSIKSSRISLEMLRAHQFSSDRIKLTLNHANSANTVKQADVEQALAFPVFWSVPYDVEVATCSQIGRLVVQAKPKCKTSRAIKELARAISGSGSAHAGLMSRFAGR